MCFSTRWYTSMARFPGDVGILSPLLILLLQRRIGCENTRNRRIASEEHEGTFFSNASDFPCLRHSVFRGRREVQII